jgi:hypothetical protein
LKVLFPGQFGRPNSSKLGELKEFVCLWPLRKPT